MENITLTTVICQCLAGRIQDNLAAMEKWVRAAKEKGSEMVCFPELNITGYSTLPDIQGAAIPVQDLLHPVQDLAMTHDVVILCGWAEKGEAGGIYASHLAMEPRGLIGIYRKLHVAPPEQSVFTPGGEIPVFEAKGLRFGIQLCYDAHFPELSTAMARKGVDAILMPHASPGRTPEEKMASWMRHLPARAYDNSLYVVAWNQTGGNGKGLTFPGLAMAFGPSGNLEKHTLGREEAMMTLTLTGSELDRVRKNRMHYFLPHRREDLFP
jgi:N-carbamoylputrescine amidase